MAPTSSASPPEAQMTAELKLRATDDEDLAVVSAILQDAVIPIEEMAYLPERTASC